MHVIMLPPSLLKACRFSVAMVGKTSIANQCSVECIIFFLPIMTYRNSFLNTLSFFYKQLVYKQLALGWKIAMQLSGFNPLSLSNNKNYRLKFLCDKRKIDVKPTIHQNSAVPEALLGKF